jgi:hypothetical protein
MWILKDVVAFWTVSCLQKLGRLCFHNAVWEEGWFSQSPQSTGSHNISWILIPSCEDSPFLIRTLRLRWIVVIDFATGKSNFDWYGSLSFCPGNASRSFICFENREYEKWIATCYRRSWIRVFVCLVKIADIGDVVESWLCPTRKVDSLCHCWLRVPSTGNWNVIFAQMCAVSFGHVEHLKCM